MFVIRAERLAEQTRQPDKLKNASSGMEYSPINGQRDCLLSREIPALLLYIENKVPLMYPNATEQ